MHAQGNLEATVEVLLSINMGASAQAPSQPAAPTQSAPGPPLSVGWVSHTDLSSGRTYCYNTRSDMSQQEAPTQPPEWV